MKTCGECGHSAVHHNRSGCWCMMPAGERKFRECPCERNRSQVLYDPPDDDDYETLLRNVTI